MRRFFLFRVPHPSFARLRKRVGILISDDSSELKRSRQSRICAPLGSSVHPVVKLLILITLLVTVASEANAQRMSQGMTSRGARLARGAHQRSGLFPLGLFPYYDESPSGSDVPAAPSQTLVRTLQSPPAPPPQPLMIELQGDRYVRVASSDDSGMRMIASDLTEANFSNAPSVTAKPSAQRELDPVVLIFRDGHRENIFDYTIADGTLYAQADFHVDGSWSKQIALSSLNLPDTIEANQSRGVPFRLPSAPNEIIIRP